MKKFKNIAVVLRGHVRTWHFNAPKVFDFYDSIAENVDYYFITWDSSNTDRIEGTFKDQNLIHFQILNWQLENSILTGGSQAGKWYNGHLGPPFMNMLALPHIRRQEKHLGNKYECVFDTRPDVLPVRNIYIKGEFTGEPVPLTKPKDKSVYVTGLELQTNLSPDNHKTGLQDIAIKDWCLYMNSDVYEVMTNRYHKDHFVYTLGTGPGTQIELREYIAENNMHLCTNDWVKAYMMRPCVYQLDWLDSQSTGALIDCSNTWQSLDPVEKIALCERYGISLSDYVDTPSITCKI